MPGHTFESKPWGDRRCLRCARVLQPGYRVEWIKDTCPGNTAVKVDVEALTVDPVVRPGDRTSSPGDYVYDGWLAFAVATIPQSRLARWWAMTRDRLRTALRPARSDSSRTPRPGG